MTVQANGNGDGEVGVNGADVTLTTGGLTARTSRRPWNLTFIGEGWLRQHPKVLGLQFVDNIRRPDRDNAIDIYISDEHDDILADGVWQNTFKVKPEVFTAEEKQAWIAQMSGVTVGSDAFFPFGDNVERARKSGVQYIAQPGGSIRDQQVIDTANKYGMVMAFTGIRLFHH